MKAELHAHVFMDGIDYKRCVVLHKEAPNEEHIRRVFAAYRDWGIDFIREGGDHFGVSTLAKSISPEYGITYISPVFAIYKEGNYGRVAGCSYSSMAEYRALIERAADEGADFIKLMLSGILDFDQFGVVSETDYTLSEMKELVHIAHGEGFAVMAHVSGSENIINALLAGVDSLEHGYYISKEGIEMLAGSDCVWVPTTVTSGNLRGTGRFDEVAVERIFETHKENIAAAAAAGAAIGCGSDAGAYGVLHGTGALEEHSLLCSLMGDGAQSRLGAAAETVRRKFSSRR